MTTEKPTLRGLILRRDELRTAATLATLEANQAMFKAQGIVLFPVELVKLHGGAPITDPIYALILKVLANDVRIKVTVGEPSITAPPLGADFNISRPDLYPGFYSTSKITLFAHHSWGAVAAEMSCSTKDVKQALEEYLDQEATGKDSMSIKIRVGVPLPGGRLARGARDLGAPLLISANALARKGKDGAFKSWRTNLPDFEGTDLALDSAGFVAWAHYGGFPWAVSDYLELVAARDWAWWAQMDACVEPEIAGSPEVVRLRQAETLRLWVECSEGAKARGLPAPIPVLQGWTPADYVWIVREFEALGAFDGAPLVGVGSMCRRHIHGPLGLLAVLDALDAVLPPQIRLHLFGVKGGALPYLLTYGGRVASIDSMAWDVAARRRAHREDCSCSMPLRVEEMGAWYSAQLDQMKKGAAPVQGSLLTLNVDAEDESSCEALDRWARLVMSGEVDVRTAIHHFQNKQAEQTEKTA